jgi:hypothetical protein
MPINKDLSELPAADRAVGVPPAADNYVAEALANRWFANYLASGQDAKARALPELPYRASYASKRCDRQLYYALSDTPESEPLTPASAWTMGLGTMVHDHLQRVIQEMWPNAECEPTIDLRPLGIPGSGHADIVVTESDGSKTLIEVKTTGGFSFKMMATSFKGAPEGPRYSYLLQAAMMAKAVGADRFVIALLSLEPVSPQLADTYASSEAGRFAAEWHYETADFDDDIRREAQRVDTLLKHVGTKVLPPRKLLDPEYPAGAQVTAPLAARAPWVVYGEAKDTVVDSGSYWGCAYCPWRTQCHEDGE